MSSYPKNPSIRTAFESWISPIYDRTSSDIENKTTKAYLNVEDINRIEANTYNLSNAYNLKLVCKKWDRDNIPTKENFERIRSNTEKLIQKVDANETLAINSKPNYEDINKIESYIDTVHNYLINNTLNQPMADFYVANEPIHLLAERNK